MRGGSRPNAGRKPGSKTLFNKELALRLATSGQLQPLDVLLAMMNDPELSPEIRVRAAAAAAPYVHRRKPQTMEVTGKFEFLDPAQREERRQLLLEEIRVRQARGAGPSSN